MKDMDIYSLTFTYPFMLSQQQKNPYLRRMSRPGAELLIVTDLLEFCLGCATMSLGITYGHLDMIW